jgi:hypothetical protein
MHRMRHYITALTAATLVTVALAAPADAQMRRSTPAPGVAAAKVVGAGPTGADEYRPTNVFGVQRAQTLMSGATVVGIDGGNLALNYGINPDLELGVLAGLDLNRIGANFDTNLNVGAGVKYRFVNADNLGVAGMGGLNLGKADGSTNLQTSLFAALPVSFWINQRGAFHVVPTIGMGPDAANQTQTTFGTGLAYEMELNPTWRLMIADRISFANNIFSNTYEAGVRVGVTPNTTVDVSLINGYLNFGTPANSNLGQANVTLLNFSAYFGGPAAQVRQSFGL